MNRALPSRREYFKNATNGREALQSCRARLLPDPGRLAPSVRRQPSALHWLGSNRSAIAAGRKPDPRAAGRQWVAASGPRRFDRSRREHDWKGDRTLHVPVRSDGQWLLPPSAHSLRCGVHPVWLHLREDQVRTENPALVIWRRSCARAFLSLVAPCAPSSMDPLKDSPATSLRSSGHSGQRHSDPSLFRASFAVRLRKAPTDLLSSHSRKRTSRFRLVRNEAIEESSILKLRAGQ
jgi:hypothetical protein